MDQRNVYAIPELDPTDNDVNNVTDQRLESSMENDAETLQDTNVIQEPDLPQYEVLVGPNNKSDEEED
ncbi:unnamed protein product [Prunus armeniaca]